MAAGREYIIQFVGLGVGKHEYEFDIKDKFFEQRDYSEIKRANIKVNLELLKQSAMMSLTFKVSGTVNVNCDLCTDEFDLPIEGEYKLIVKVGGSDATEEDDDIITIAANEHELDLEQYIYEYIVLSLPIKREHPKDKKGNYTCNKETLEKLQNYIIENEPDEQTDPRWDGLKNIKLN